MWCSLILVHRPFATFKTEQGDEENKTLLHPLDICLTCANDICDTLEEYEENLPKLSCDMIFPIYLTASTLSHINKKNGRDDPPTLRRIDLCVKWLLILGKNWKNGNARKAMLVNAGGKTLLSVLLISSTDNLPDLRPQHEIPRPASAAMSTHLNSSPQINQVSDVGRHTPALGSMTPGPRLKLEEQQHHLDPAAPADFWAYLDSFEDAEDPFYRMDAEFRELLQNQFDPHLGANGPPAPSGGQVMG
jgi:hypothetical protein